MPEDIACYLCGHYPGNQLFSSWDIVHNLDGSFAWNRCPNCGLIYLSPRPTPDEMSRYYPTNYALFQSAMRRRHWWQPSLWLERRDINRRCKAAACLRSQGCILDVGCGTGEFLAAMRQRGWETIGIELTPAAATYAREQLQLDIKTGTLHEIDLPSANFDVITLWTVLEHLYDPLSTLQKIHSILCPDGLLLISIPDVESLDAKWFGRYWVGYDTPRHLYVYSHEVLCSLLNRAGFEIYATEHFQADYYTFLASFKPWFEANLNYKKLPNLLNFILKFPGIRMLTWPIFWTINKLARGCIITIYAQPT
jgi:2-polyprenyl-3-methyl-5-hydroxy-6-metoxy-1,4-benzoquinol methylase